MGTAGKDNSYGHGRLNAYEAVKKALPSQYDGNLFATNTTLNSAHIYGQTDILSGVTLTVPQDKVVVLAGDILGAGTNVFMEVNGKVVINEGATVERVHFKVEDGGELIIQPGAEIKMSTGAWHNVRVNPGGKITAHGTHAKPIKFTRYNSGTAWGQIGLRSSEGNSFKWVLFDGGNKTVDILSKNNVFEHCTFRNGWRGVSSGSNIDGSGNSSAVFKNVLVEDNETVGLVAYYMDADISYSTMQDNDQAGLYIYSGTVNPFHNNLVTNNGVSYSRDGIEVTSSGNITMQDYSLSGGYSALPGYNEVSYNSDDQISSSGQTVVGIYFNGEGGHSVIKGTYGSNNKYLIDNNNGSYEIPVYSIYWGESSYNCSMFDGGCGTVKYEDDDLPSDPTTEEQVGAGLVPKLNAEHVGFQNITEAYQEYERRLNQAQNTSEVRENLHQLYLTILLAGKESPEFSQAFNQLVKEGADGTLIKYARSDQNQEFRDVSKILYLKNMIREGNYEQAGDYLGSMEASSLTNYDRRDYLHLRLTVQNYHGEYESAWQTLQEYYTHEESRGEDMEEIRALNFVIEENLIANLNGIGIDPETIETEKPEISLTTYPNPFNPATSINFTLPDQAFVSLKVFDLLGREVAELVNEERKAGTHQVSFNGSNLASGIYLYRLEFGNTIITNRMTLIK